MNFMWPEMGDNNYKQTDSWFCLLSTDLDKFGINL